MTTLRSATSGRAHRAPAPRPRPESCSRPLWLALLALVAGCHTDMRDQPRYEAYEASPIWDNHQAMRPLIAGTVPRTRLNADSVFFRGRDADGQFVAQPPLPRSPELLRQGQAVYTAFCVPCHSPLGDGNGMIVQRGLKRPPSFHIERLQNAPAGYYFDIVTHGFGVMPSYAARITPAERWAVIAYIRALQLSQHASPDDVPAADRPRLTPPPAIPSTQP